MHSHTTSQAGTRSTDLVVLGSGAAGLAAAVTAAWHGLAVTLVEKTDHIGGTTAWSGGWIWAPCNPPARRAGIEESPTEARRYLAGVLGNRFNAERIDAFLDASPAMIDFFETETALDFEPGLAIPDTYGHVEGAGLGGRSVIARAYDARQLGEHLALLRKPLCETTFHGMTIQAGSDLRAFMTMTRSPRAFLYASTRTAVHARDLALHGRGMALRNGQALVARLLRSAIDLGVEVRTGNGAERLQQSDGRITGVVLSNGEPLMATRGVVLACGGFPHDTERRADTFVRNREHQTLAIGSASGDGLAMASRAGGTIDTEVLHPAAYCPVSQVDWPDGHSGLFPHIIDRGKPGLIAVLENGKRFCNEGLGYHDYVTALQAAVEKNSPARSWLICDHRFLRRYGLGVVRPRPVPWRAWVKRGYLKSAGSIAALARACGIDPNGLDATVKHWNEAASLGEDRDFGRGSTAYMRLQGDPEQRPNPCVAPIVKPPFHAVEVIPGSFGTFAGIATDGKARVLDRDGSVIAGLYAAGTDAASIFGGHYPAGGINLGPALTFGWIAGSHAAGAVTGTSTCSQASQ